MYIAKLTTEGNEYFLRGTAWAFQKDRATIYPDRVTADAAVEKAAKFMKKRLVKTVEIVAC